MATSQTQPVALKLNDLLRIPVVVNITIDSRALDSTNQPEVEEKTKAFEEVFDRTMVICLLPVLNEKGLIPTEFRYSYVRKSYSSGDPDETVYHGFTDQNGVKHRLSISIEP